MSNVNLKHQMQMSNGNGVVKCDCQRQTTTSNANLLDDTYSQRKRDKFDFLHTAERSCVKQLAAYINQSAYLERAMYICIYVCIYQFIYYIRTYMLGDCYRKKKQQ